MQQHDEQFSRTLAEFIHAQRTANEKAAAFAAAATERYGVSLDDANDPRIIEQALDDAEGVQNGTFYFLGAASVIRKTLDVLDVVGINPDAAKDFPREHVMQMFNFACDVLDKLAEVIEDHATGLDEFYIDDDGNPIQ